MENKAAFAIWITGLPASGKSMLTAALVRRLRALGKDPEVLESDALRLIFSDGGAAYDDQAREYFYGAIALIGAVLTERGIPVIFDATANRRSYRDRARQRISRFIEVYVECPLEVCIRRDPKGIYRQAMEGKARNVPGMGATFEHPEHPDVLVHGDRDDVDEAAQRVVRVLQDRGFLGRPSK